MNELTYERAAELFLYEPVSGLMTRRISTSANAKEGMIVGCLDKSGYVKISVSKRLYYFHRVAWLLMTGNWPEALVDHINGNPSDNRWENLRAATKQENGRNQKTHKRGSSGIKGVIIYGDRWIARLGRKHLGVFSSKEEAATRVQEERGKIHKEFARHS